MFKIFSALLCLGMLMVSVDTRAADNLTMTKYTNSSQLPESFYNLGGGNAMASKTYKDDDGKARTDKVYYITTHSYKSSYKMEDVARLLNPAAGRLGSLFEDTEVNKSSNTGVFNVLMEISTPIKNFSCASILNFKNSQEGKKNVFVYTFSNFNMVFTDLVIKVELEDLNSELKVKVSQIAALKGSTYTKLSNYFAVGKFEKSMKLNIKKLKDGVGGI